MIRLAQTYCKPINITLAYCAAMQWLAGIIRPVLVTPESL